ncbi:sugar transferase [Mucilaginibacter sp. CSA2-8R]|uniref:sugar transferase n=1 Tax=Mucilaginibacter sp. CSA2-8R TaxID=3141542 RepID=UPI00315D89B8
MNQSLPLPAEQPFFSTRTKIAYVGSEFSRSLWDDLKLSYHVDLLESIGSLEAQLGETSFLNLPDVLLFEVGNDEACFSCIERIRMQPSLEGLIIILLSRQERQDWRVRAVSLKVHDLYVYPFDTTDLIDRIRFLIKIRVVRPLQVNRPIGKQRQALEYKMPISKRIFDIVVSAVALFLLSPFFLVIALIIALESRGPVIYRSKRVGTGYKVFDFYKFRSMNSSADQQLDQLASQNQYAGGHNKKAVFTKISDDPRVTRVGQFIRNTSIDELPQLFNILIGDMSFVGNRPLPVYEAELLTSNEWSMRFMGPAGLTGLWQISKRGKKDMSETERKELDNFYAKQHSFFLDLKIMIKTIPALIQTEKV